MSKNNKNKILIVDDHDEIRQNYVELFKKNGYTVLEAKDGVEGLDIATSKDGIDVIFTGIIMPRMDGFQLFESLKEYSNTAKIPVVVNSHLGKEEDRIKMEKLGARDFIIRGTTTSSEVLKRVTQAINQGGYWFKIDPLEMDAQKYINDFKMPTDLKCRNCGSALAIRAKFQKNNKMKCVIKCPNCKLSY